MDEKELRQNQPTGVGRDGGEDRNQLIASLMQRMADGDNAAAFELVDRFEPELRGTVVRIASSRGVTFASEDLTDLVIDVAVEINKLARAWKPTGGARPWTWAHHRIAAIVDAQIGQHTTPLDSVVEPAAASGDEVRSGDHEDSHVAVMERLANDDPLVALLSEALDQLVSPRDRRLFLEIEVQQVMGDRSPAATAAALIGVSGAAARQQHRRTRQRLQRLAATNPRFAPLADLAIVA